MGKIKKVLSKVTDLPPSSFERVPYITVEGNISFKLDFCDEILSYDENGAEFLCRELKISMIGENLEMSSYGNSTVKIDGKIISINIEEKNHA